MQCEYRLSHMITLSPIPEGLAVSNLRRLELATCTAYLGWIDDYLYYEHDKAGRPRQYDHPQQKEPEFPPAYFKPATVTLVPTPQRWYWQDHAFSNSRENLHRIGGEPSWIQGPNYPQCLKCDNLMDFILQIDSDLPTDDGGEWMWGDSGMCYVFWCDNCKMICPNTSGI